MTAAAQATPWRPADLLTGGISLSWLIPGLAAMAVLFVWPITHLVALSIEGPPGAANPYVAIMTEPLYLRVMVNTGVSALSTTILCLLIGYPAAYAIHVLRPPWRTIVLGSVLLSYAVGTMPRAFSWIVLLGDRGLLNRMLMQAFDLRQPVSMLYNQSGVLIGMTHVMLPFIVLTLLASMARVPPRLVPAARTMGAGPWRAFASVFLPMTLPGILAGVMMTFIYSLGFYVVPAVLGGAGQTTVVMVLRDLTLGLGRWSIGSALSITVIVVCVTGAAIYVPLARIGEAADQ